MAVELGPFEIQSRFATGGMGEIWRGLHVDRGVPVAIKVITGPNAMEAEYHDEFRREVQAVARLSHPNIVQVFDYGVLPEEVASLGELMPGSPYLVMEYASRGSLADQLEPVNWRDLKNILMSVLGALAHAHARDVIHRDIKPGNVLLGSHHETPPRIILTDFGVAHATDRQTRTDAMDFTARSTEEASGTPRYMAPEQFMGKWRNYGPWTDLYAVGIMAYQLACGKLPFKGATFMMLAMAHLNNAMPPLTPQIDIPEEFEDWVRRLTEKDPADRFQSAADAAWALTEFSDSHLLFSELSNIAGEQEYDSYDDATDMLPTRIDFAPPEALRVFTMSKTSDHRSYPDAPALPLTWQEAAPPTSDASMVGAGLGLFGLRSIPMVDREDERTTIWEAFKESHVLGRQTAVVLKGLAGTGKSRLAEWLTQLVDEVGAAQVLSCGHGPIAAPTQGLGWMLTRYFRTAGLSAEDMQARVAEALDAIGVDDDFPARALSDIMRSNQVETDTTSKFVPFSSPEQRFGVIRNLLEQLSHRRPVVLLFDDVQWGWECLEFARFVLSDTHELPVLFVLVVSEEELVEREEERHSLDALVRLPNVRECGIPPLTYEDLRSLVSDHLLLPAHLGKSVARRAGGSPLFAIQLIEDWVKRGVLVVEDSRLAVKPGEKANLPRTLSEVWESRIEYLVQQLSTVRAGEDTQRTRRPVDPEKVHLSFELAAAFGQDVDLKEWQTACEKKGWPAFGEMIDEMARLRMANIHVESNGFSFINAQLREVLIQSAEENGRWKSHNMHCAKVLTSLYNDDHDGLAERVGRHFLEAKAYMLAVTCLREALRKVKGTRDQADSAELNDLLALTYTRMGVDKDDPRWAELWVRRGIPMIYSEDLDVFRRGQDLLDRAEKIARGSGQGDVLARILRAQAWACAVSGSYDEGLEKVREAAELTENPEVLASIARTHGHVLLESRNAPEAKPFFEETLELAPDSVHAVWARQQLAECARLEWNLEHARDLASTALAAARSEGVSLAEAAAHDTLSRICLMENQRADAVSHATQAYELRTLMGCGSLLELRSRALQARINLMHDDPVDPEDFDELARRLEQRVGEARSQILDLVALKFARDQNWDTAIEKTDGLLENEADLDPLDYMTLAKIVELASRAGQNALSDELGEALKTRISQLPEAAQERIDVDRAMTAQRLSEADEASAGTSVVAFDPDFEAELNEPSEPEEYLGVQVLTPDDIAAARNPSSDSFLPYDPDSHEGEELASSADNDGEAFDAAKKHDHPKTRFDTESRTEAVDDDSPAIDLELAELEELELEPAPQTGSRMERVKEVDDSSASRTDDGSESN